MMLWTGPGGLRDEDQNDTGCDGDCGSCHSSDCDERGADCADPENCEDCPKRETCKAAKTEEDEE